MLPILRQLFSDWPVAAPILVALPIVLSLATLAAVLLDRRCRSLRSSAREPMPSSKSLHATPRSAARSSAAKTGAVVRSSRAM